jgi:hypothetical protein
MSFNLDRFLVGAGAVEAGGGDMGGSSVDKLAMSG